MQILRIGVVLTSDVLLRREICLKHLNASADRLGGAGKAGGRVLELAGGSVALPLWSESALATVERTRVGVGTAGAEQLRATASSRVARATFVELEGAEAILAPGITDLVEAAILESEHVHRHPRMPVVVREPLKIDVAKVHAGRTDGVGGDTADGTPT